MTSGRTTMTAIGCDNLSGSIKDKAKHVFDSDKDAVCDVCGYERQIENPGDDNKPEQPDDKPNVPGGNNKPEQPDDKPNVPSDDNKPEQPDDKPTVPGDDKKSENPDDNNPVTPGESEDVKPGECSGDPIVNPDTDGRLDIAIFAISVVSLAGAFAVRRKK